MTAGDYAAAAVHFEEASYASYYFTDLNNVSDLALMEEAFRYGALNRVLSNGKVVFPSPAALATAAAWAKTNRFIQLYASLLVLAPRIISSSGRRHKPWRCWKRRERRWATGPSPPAGLPRGERSWLPPHSTRPAGVSTAMRCSPR